MKKAFLFSLKRSIPIFISFLPLGIAYGILMQKNGYNFVFSSCCSLFILAGSLQFLMIDFFNSQTPLATVALLSLVLNSRHIFYGIPFLEKWRDYGPSKLFLIFALPDEAFSLHCDNDFDDGNEEHKKQTYIFTALLVMLFWVLFTMIGGLLGEVLSFNTDGIDFAMTALFIVILINMIKSSGNTAPALLAVVSSVICFLVFGADAFIFPSLLLSALVLVLFKDRIEAKK